MGTTTVADIKSGNNSTAVARPATFSNFMVGDAIKRKINEIIGSKKGDGFITSIVAAVSNNPALSGCEHGTILSAGLQGAALDLSPSPSLGHFYMVPFDDRKNNRKVAQFQIGYKGYIQLAIRSGQYRRINVIALKEGELVSYNRLTEEVFTRLIDDDEIRDELPTTGYYAMFELTNGFIKTMYWSRAKMEAHAIRYSKGYAAKKGYTFWEKDFDGMAFKTMLRQLLSKWGVMSIEMTDAFDSDMAVIGADGKTSYVDNQDDGPPDIIDRDDRTVTNLGNVPDPTPEPMEPRQRRTKPSSREQQEPPPYEPSPEEVASIHAREMQESGYTQDSDDGLFGGVE